MEESYGAQFALQIALQTLRERCHEFQQRISLLEEENLNLRGKLATRVDISDTSLSEVESLKQQITQLTEQNLQLTNNVAMVTTENRRLWSRLSRLTQANENLGSKLTKINDTLSQPNVLTHSTLIRSKTFTQEEPHIKLVPKNVTDENSKISLELEDISLKLICNIAKEKSELELQCSQMTEIQNNESNFVDTFAFAYEDVDGSILDEFNQYLKDLKNVHQILLQEKDKLQENLINLESITVQCKCVVIKEPRITTTSQFVQTKIEDKVEEDMTNKINQPVSSKENDRICPMCSQIFNTGVCFEDFQEHVESHFTSEADNLVVTP
ncbi:hypothetical protein RN001_004218 [Aquatica leii]|uniref:UBZ1-type domain-containing protein n=1 Tax=Aquatica leii TaxID=1421715 RepID=A0AAN7PB31_9COLE|nr:hypothetical protein RN001_004218 [Aquatica leii]